MYNNITHQILLAQTFPTGAQVWSCAECSYSVIVKFHDPYEPTTIVIDTGDVLAHHVAIRTSNTSTFMEYEDTLDTEDEDRIRYLEKKISDIIDAVDNREEPD